MHTLLTPVMALKRKKKTPTISGLTRGLKFMKAIAPNRLQAGDEIRQNLALRQKNFLYLEKSWLKPKL
jgi:hypothetical protein